MRLLDIAKIKITPGTPRQTKLFFLFLGIAAVFMGCDGILSESDHSPRRKIGKIIYLIFGPYGDQYFYFFFGLGMIYLALFKSDNKRNLNKFKNK